MIPLAIAIGIIEDKIANDLTSKDTKARECLEDVKAKISRHKPKQYKITIEFKGFSPTEFIVDDIKIQDCFVMTNANGVKTYFNKDIISKVCIYTTDADTEDDYVEGTIRGLKDLGE